MTTTNATYLQVVLWGKKAREATERRNEAIRAMHAEGGSLRAIAEAAGLSHTAIAKILERVTPPA